jgi:hypothetical protein
MLALATGLALTACTNDPDELVSLKDTSRANHRDAATASPLRRLAITTLPRGFDELPAGSPEVGVFGLARTAALFNEEAKARRFYRGLGYVTGYSRHWVRGGMLNDSLVIGIWQFRSTDAAYAAYCVPSCLPTDAETRPVPGLPMAKLTVVRYPDRQNVTDYRSHRFQSIAATHWGPFVVRIVARSSTDVHPASELHDLARAQFERLVQRSPEVLRALDARNKSDEDHKNNARAKKLRGLITAAVPAGFQEQPDGAPQVGTFDLDRETLRFGSNAVAGRKALIKGGYVRGYSRHWVRGGILQDSLVIGVLQFASAAGARYFYCQPSCLPREESVAPIPGLRHGRIDLLAPFQEPLNGDFRNLRYQTILVVQEGPYMALIWSRSVADNHPTSELYALATAQADVLRKADKVPDR